MMLMHSLSQFMDGFIIFSVGQSLVYHLSDLRGMSLWHDKFGILGLCSSTLQEAVLMAGSFMLKASELQQ